MEALVLVFVKGKSMEGWSMYDDAGV